MQHCKINSECLGVHNVTSHFSFFIFHLKSVLIFIFSLLAFHLSNGQDLSYYIQEALENNPDVQAFRLKYERAKEKANEVNTLPNTQFGAGYFVSEPETRTGAQQFKLSAMQTLPWFGTIGARKNYTNALAETEYQDIAIVKRKLGMSITQSYYNLYAIKAKRNILLENIQLLETYEKLVFTAVKASNASAIDVLRLQIRQYELAEQIQVLEREFLAEQTLFNNLLNRDNDIIVGIPSSLPFPLEKTLLNAELFSHPELTKYDKLYKSIEKLELLNKKEGKPQIRFELNYINVSERPGLNFSDNGKDVLMPMASVAIPIFNEKYKSKTKQNKIKQQEIKAQQQSRLNTLKTLLDKAIKMQEASKISYYTHEKNLERTQNVETILIKTYETGIVNFDDILDIQELQLKFQTQQVEAIKNYYMQEATINYIID